MSAFSPMGPTRVFLSLFFLLSLAGISRAAITQEEIAAGGITILRDDVSPALDEPTILDADEGFDGRHELEVEVDCEFASSSFSGDSATYRVRARLLDGSGNFVDLDDGAGGTMEFAASSPVGVSPTLFSPVDETFTVRLDPAVVLQLDEEYRIDARLERLVVVGTLPSGFPDFDWQEVDAQTGDPERIFHFDGLANLDPEVNVRAVIDGVDIDRNHLVDTDEDLDTLPVSASVVIRRYDEIFSGPPGPEEIDFRVDFDLLETDNAGNPTGVSVPLVNDGIVDQSISVSSWSLNALFEVSASRQEALISGELELDGVQLPSSSSRYILSATLQHIEVPPGGGYVTDYDLAGSHERLLHFNGRLLAGPNEFVLGSVSNTPLVGSLGSGVLSTNLAITGLGTVLIGNPDLGFGSGAVLGVDLFDDGRAEMTGGSETLTSLTDPGTGFEQEIGGTRLGLNDSFVNSSGAFAQTATLFLPQGLSVAINSSSAANRYESQIDVGGTFIALTNAGLPASTILDRSLGASGGFVDEGHPILFGASKVEFEVATGRIVMDPTSARYLHDAALDSLDQDRALGNLADPDLADRRSNDQFLRNLDPSQVADTRSRTAADGTSRLSARLALDPNVYETHFPLGSQVSFANTSDFEISEGDVVPAESRLDGVGDVRVNYLRSCPDGCVSSGAAATEVTMVPDDGILELTPQGGLHRPGDVTNDGVLTWGLFDNGGGLQYTHRTGLFERGSFFAPGYHLYAGNNPLLADPGFTSTAAEQAPGLLLLAGYENESYARFGEAPYQDGFGSYAGLTMVVESSMQGASRPGRIGADWTYELRTEDSKYYVRESGVSGRHPAVNGSYAENLTIYGFDFSISRYQLTFLSNENIDSWFDGSVHVPFPSNFTQSFLGLTLTCSGDLDKPEIDPSDAGDKDLQYWLGSFKPLAMSFEPPAGATACSTQPRALVFGAATQVANIPTTLYGRLGFLGGSSPELGNIASAADGYEVDSRLGIPASIAVDGPGDEEYDVSPVSKLYFNDFRQSDGNTGFVTFAGSMDVPFFQNLQAVFRTSANGASSANLFVAGGYDPGGGTIFQNGDFDDDNTGWPRGITAFDSYWDPDASDADTYLVRATQSIFGIVDITYPLDWDTGAHYFSGREQTDDLIVLNIDHNVDYLSADNAEISFGASYGGLPRLNLSNMLFDAVDSQLGAGQAFANAGLDEVRDTLGLGIDQMAEMLDDSMEAVFDAAFEQAEQEVLRPLYQAAESSYNQTLVNNPAQTYNGWINDGTDGLEKTLNDFLTSTTSVETSLVEQLQKLKDANGEAASVVVKVEDALTKIIIGIDSVAGTLERGQNGEFQLDLDANDVTERVLGLLARGEIVNGSVVGDQRDIVGKLIKELLREMVEPEVAAIIEPLIDQVASELNTRLNALLEEIDPALDKIQEILMDVRSLVSTIREEVRNAGDFLNLIDEVISNAIAEIQSIAAEVKSTAKNFIDQIITEMNALKVEPMAGQQNPFENMTEDEFVELCRAELRDLFLQSDIVEQIRYMLRQKLFDIDMQIRSAVDSAFAAAENAMKEVIRDTVGELESEINPLLGKIEEYMGSGEISGYAHIEGDSLRKLRLDGEFQLSIPEEMGLTAYLEILTYDSGDDYAAAGCLEPGEEVTEVRFGAVDVKLDWIAEDMRASVEAKFSMKTISGKVRPNGVGGSFQMTGGELEFQSFEIFRLQASLGIGFDECYLAAGIGVKISGYSAEGGIFFGRTCTLAPLEMVDPDAASLLGNPPFTGAYVYGEVWIPVSEVVLGIPASCLFEISAGVGAGAFYFVEGPTFGGRMLLGVSGEALCVVGIKGEVSMVGVMAGGSLRFNGTGTLTGKAGWCPFCIKFNESVGVTYQDGSWSLN